MGGARKKSKQASLSSSGFYPLMTKTGSAVGKNCSVPGRFWEKCPAADKEKRFACVVVEFRAVHDYGSGKKGAGFLMKEMGESGTGSLEQGVASGDEFVIAYPAPFLEYYWHANREELPTDVRLKLFPADAAERAPQGNAVAAEDTNAEIVQEEESKPRVRPPIFDHLELVSSTLNTSGSRRGTYTNKYKCLVPCASGSCTSSITLYGAGDGKAETTSNAWGHLRAKAEQGCREHTAVLASLNATNSKAVVDPTTGDYVSVMSFKEAFPHHVDYVWCRAQGLFTARLGSKPLFKTYVRGDLTQALQHCTHTHAHAHMHTSNSSTSTTSTGMAPLGTTTNICPPLPGTQATSHEQSFLTMRSRTTSRYASKSCKKRSSCNA